MFLVSCSDFSGSTPEKLSLYLYELSIVLVL